MRDGVTAAAGVGFMPALPDGGPIAVVADAASSLGRLDPEGLARIDLLVAGHDLSGESGPMLIDRLRARGIECPVLFLVPAGDAALTADLLEGGAADVVIADTRDLRPVTHAIRRQVEAVMVHGENQHLHHQLTQSLVELELKNAELERMVDRLERSVRTDELTGLASRRWLDATLAGSWAEATRHDLPLAFVMIDLDGFKQLNDVAGHQAGDEILRLVGRVLHANCRGVDTAARYGGDEFSILLPHTEPEEALAVAARILEAFREAVAGHDLPSTVGMSIGVAHVDRSRPVNAEDLVRHADEAMYAAKAEFGGDTVAVREGLGPARAIIGSADD